MPRPHPAPSSLPQGSRTHPAPSARALCASALAALAWLGACQSAPEGEPESAELGNYQPIQKDDAPIGMLLADIDRQVSTWGQLTLTARSEEDRIKARGLELNLARITKPRVAELIEQLETGAPLNRTRAAAALGFSQDSAAQAPLLAALFDPLDAVISNALISLGTLQRADTPLERICELAGTHPDAQLRSNACRALVWIVNAGGSGECVLSTARLGLADPEPAVRAQAALLAGMQHDGDSVRELSDLLYDEHPLVSRASASALVAIANHRDSARGAASRALVAALDQIGEARRPIVRASLVQIREADLGDDTKAWVEWARNMP